MLSPFKNYATKYRCVSIHLNLDTYHKDKQVDSNNKYLALQQRLHQAHWNFIKKYT